LVWAERSATSTIADVKPRQSTALCALFAISLSITARQETSKQASASSFRFVLKYGVGSKNVLDTVAGKFTKDLIGSTATADLKLTDLELNQVREKLTQIDFWNDQKFPRVFTVPNWHCTMDPHDSMIFSAAEEAKVKELAWQDMSSRQVCPPEVAIQTYRGTEFPPAEQLRELVRLIQQIIESKVEFQKLPRTRGAYF
jgi:hypothetical protein